MAYYLIMVDIRKFPIAGVFYLTFSMLTGLHSKSIVIKSTSIIYEKKGTFMCEFP